MTTPPLPDVNTVRVRLIYNETTLGEAGNRFYLSFTGSSPNGADCATLATTIASAYATNIAPHIDQFTILQEVDVLDISTDHGASGQWTGTHAGGDTSATIPSSVAINVEFGIARRYRGGKPRIFFPPPGQDAVQDQVHWTAALITAMNSAVPAFFTACITSPPSSFGTMHHINLSYYQGFHNITNSSGRERAVPTYRSTAKSDLITGYFTKSIVGSQKRRRTSTTP